MDNTEIWKPIWGYGGRYMVSNMGRVMSMRERKFHTKDGCVTKQVRYILRSVTFNLSPAAVKRRKTSLRSYSMVTLCKGGVSKNFYVHRLVADAFLGVKPKGLVTDHINGDKYDNRLCNLRYVTTRQNVCYSEKTRSPQGKRPIRVTLTKLGCELDFLSATECLKYIRLHGRISNNRFWGLIRNGGGFVRLSDGDYALLERRLL